MSIKNTAYGLLALSMLACCATNMPVQPLTNKSVWLEQNWTAAQREWFHHASQGTATIPVPPEWFLALEQPVLMPFGTPGLFNHGVRSCLLPTYQTKRPYPD